MSNVLNYCQSPPYVCHMLSVVVTRDSVDPYLCVSELPSL